MPRKILKCPGEGFWYLAHDFGHAAFLASNIMMACSHSHRIYVLSNLEDVSERLPQMPILFPYSNRINMDLQ